MECRAGQVQKHPNKTSIKNPVGLNPTLKAYSEQVFMPGKPVTMSENSRSNFQSYLNNQIYPALGNYRMCEITPTMISQFLLSL